VGDHIVLGAKAVRLKGGNEGGIHLRIGIGMEASSRDAAARGCSSHVQNRTKKSNLTEALKSMVGGLNHTFADMRKSASSTRHTSSSCVCVTQQGGPVVPSPQNPVGFVPSTPINIHMFRKM